MRKGSDTDYLSIDFSDAELMRQLNEMRGKVRRENVAKATMEIAEQIYQDEINAFRSTYSGQAYTDIIASPQRRHSKNGNLFPQGLYKSQSYNQRDAVVSISPTYSDFRLHWFESGTQIRKTSKGYNRGEMKVPGFFAKTFEQNGQKYSDMLARKLNDLIKQ